jgi:hypothetical protein
MFGFGKKSDEQVAEDYIMQDCTPDGSHVSALARHYHVDETSRILQQFAGVSLTGEQTESVVQRVRDRYNMGPIDDGNRTGVE